MSHAIREATIVAAKKSGRAMSMRRSVDQIRTTHTGPMGLDGGDALMFPDFYRNVLEHNPFRNTVRMAPRVCVGPIRYVGHDKLRRDIENLKTAMVAAGADEGFMPASAPITALQN